MHFVVMANARDNLVLPVFLWRFLVVASNCGSAVFQATVTVVCDGETRARQSGLYPYAEIGQGPTFSKRSKT